INLTKAGNPVKNIFLKLNLSDHRPKRDEEFTAEENARDLADIQAASILSQGLPRHFFNTLNQTESAKEMWENIELLMKESSLSDQRKHEELFDEYERFRAIRNEYIHEYFIRFYKLANDLKITKIKIPTHQPNAKFLNNLPSIPCSSSKRQTSTIVASPTSTSSSTLDPEQQAQSGSDVMMATMQQLVNLLSGFQKQFLPTNNQLRTSSNPRSTKGNQGYGKKTDRNGKKVICYNCRSEGHVARECKEPKRAKDTQYYKDKMMLLDAKDRGVILDAEAEAFLVDVECTEPYDESLALTTTIAFQVNYEDVYDSDIDDGPHAGAAFMANLSSTEEANGTSSSKINEYLLLTEDVVPPTEKPYETHYVSPSEMYLQDQITDIIPQLEGHIKTNKDLSRASESLKAELAQCKLEMQSLEHNKVKHDLDQAIVDRNKRNTELEQENSLLKTTLFNKEESIKALNEKNNKVVSEKKDLDERNLEEIVCLQKANRVYEQSASAVKALLVHTRPAKSEVFSLIRSLKLLFPGLDPIIFQHTKNKHLSKYLLKKSKNLKKINELDDEYEQGVKKIKSLEITTRNLVREIEGLTSDSIANDVCVIMRTADVRMPQDAEISSSCVRELSKGLELEAEIAKKNKILSESKNDALILRKIILI
nr:hypothetical protein [Tanacetum cinerariifolium]